MNRKAEKKSYSICGQLINKHGVAPARAFRTYTCSSPKGRKAIIHVKPKKNRTSSKQIALKSV
ncbi:hypothetical protein HK413_00830 [Mucilaginibacter sp. S1162]|uniref:Uncharacterized protein n=1 Tax=Mucilaginibacter humi TaxID=2732510 RepID=A0ABX1VZN8_9SPHI|nr:hypothetical protein [Mucilaginibacter humi]